MYLVFGGFIFQIQLILIFVQWHQYKNVKAFLLYFQSTLTKLQL